MKKTGLFSTLFIIAFIGSYLFCCYLIPGWKIKLDADPMTYFFESIKHMALLKGLISLVERLAPEVILREKGTKKDMCANVDMYSGFVYSMMGIPQDLFTPLFACARLAGWAAHRFEEIGSGKRIIRPAYKIARPGRRAYLPIAER